MSSFCGRGTLPGSKTRLTKTAHPPVSGSSLRASLGVPNIRQRPTAAKLTPRRLATSFSSMYLRSELTGMVGFWSRFIIGGSYFGCTAWAAICCNSVMICFASGPSSTSSLMIIGRGYYGFLKVPDPRYGSLKKS
jgi:hypothetical protein